MDDVDFYVTPGFGDDLLASSHYSQAVRVGNRVETSGHGGWDHAWEFPGSVDAEIVQTFDNLTRTLDEAGVSWRNVVQVNSYHVGVDEDRFAGVLVLESFTADHETLELARHNHGPGFRRACSDLPRADTPIAVVWATELRSGH